MERKARKLLENTAIFAIGSLGSKLILFLLLPLYTSVLTTEEYGNAELVFTVSQLLLPFVSLVMHDAVIRFGLSKTEKAEDVLLTSFVVLGGSSVVTVLITPLLSLYTSIDQWKWWVCGYVILSMISSVEMNYLKVLDKNKVYAIVSVVQTAILAGLNILFLVVMDLGIEGYLLASILGSLASVLLAYYLGHFGQEIKKGAYDRQLAKRMLAFSVPLILNNVSWWVIQSSDKVMIEIMIGVSALGLYTVATKIPSFINTMISFFSQAWGISTVQELEHDNDEQFYAGVFRVYSVVAFGASILLVSIAKPFMSVYVASEYFAAWRYVPLLLASASFSAIASYYGSFYGALKQSMRNMVSTIIAALVNIAINYFGIVYCGVWGALIGTVVAYLVLAYFRMIDVLRFVKFNPRWKTFVGNSVIVLVQAVLVSLDYHTSVVSGVAVLVFLVVNMKTLEYIVERVKNGIHGFI